MAAQLIDGRQIAQPILDEIKSLVSQLDTPPGLASVVIGNDRLSHKFADLKGQTARMVGFHFEKKSFPDGFPPNKIIDYLRDQNANPRIHGVVIQLPLPNNYRTTNLLKQVHPFKDVDCLHPKNLGYLLIGQPIYITPVVLAVMSAIRSTNLFATRTILVRENEVVVPDLRGVTVCIVGGGILVGKPLTATLINLGASILLVNEHTHNLSNYTHLAKVIITGTNQQNVLDPADILPQTVLIDVGNDIQPKHFQNLDIYLAKNPGGVGPLTVAHLLQNTLTSALYSSSTKSSQTD